MTAAASRPERDVNRVRLITRGGYNWPTAIMDRRSGGQVQAETIRARWRGGGARVAYFDALHAGAPRALLLSLAALDHFCSYCVDCAWLTAVPPIFSEQTAKNPLDLKICLD